MGYQVIGCIRQQPVFAAFDQSCTPSARGLRCIYSFVGQKPPQAVADHQGSSRHPFVILCLLALQASIVLSSLVVLNSPPGQIMQTLGNRSKVGAKEAFMTVMIEHLESLSCTDRLEAVFNAILAVSCDSPSPGEADLSVSAAALPDDCLKKIRTFFCRQVLNGPRS
jgi:hypothetical protein